MSLLLANIIAIFHGAFVIFLIIAAIFSLFGQLKKYRKIELTLFMGVAATIASFLLTGECFVTKWEQQLREAAGQSYGEGFIATYLAKIGINVTGNFSFWFLATIIKIVILSDIYWNRKEIKKFFSGFKQS